MVTNPLVGTWRLVSCEFRSEDGQVSYPLGQDALGYLIYSADGHMSAGLMAANRCGFASMDTRLATVEEKAAAEDTYVTYCGPYEVQPDKVIHHLELSLLPNLTGADQVRFYKLEGDRLTISTPLMLQAGKMQASHLIWERV
jgi:hypothetical protein